MGHLHQRVKELVVSMARCDAALLASQLRHYLGPHKLRIARSRGRFVTRVCLLVRHICDVHEDRDIQEPGLSGIKSVGVVAVAVIGGVLLSEDTSGSTTVGLCACGTGSGVWIFLGETSGFEVGEAEAEAEAEDFRFCFFLSKCSSLVNPVIIRIYYSLISALVTYKFHN